MSLPETVITESLENIRTAVIDMAEAFIYEYSRNNELTGDLMNRSAEDPNKNYLKYHRKTIPVDDVKGVNDKILDLQNYEQHRIMDILNNNKKEKRVTIFDKTLDQILDENYKFFCIFIFKYNEYYKTLDTVDNVFTKHITTIVLVILDENNTIYIKLANTNNIYYII